MNFDALPDRIRALIGAGSARYFAHRAGVNEGTLRSILAGSKPTMDNLVAIARAGGVTVDWLATGEGPMERGDVMPVPAAAPEPSAGRLEIDAELHGRVVDGIAKVYKEEGVRLPDIDLGRLAAWVYADVVNAGPGSWEEKMVGLRVALEQIRRELRTAPGVPAETKRSA